MILGTGLDVFDVSRMTREVSRPDMDLPAELFTARERAVRGPSGRQARAYAALYAAKEAIFKALGTGKVGAMAWHDIDVSGTTDGACDVRLSGETARAAAALGIGRVLLSVTMTRTQAIAWAVAVQPEVENT